MLPRILISFAIITMLIVLFASCNISSFEADKKQQTPKDKWPCTWMNNDEPLYPHLVVTLQSVPL